MPTSGSGTGVPSATSGPFGIDSRSQPYTLLALERFARTINYSPYLFHQVHIQELQDASSCSDPVLQYTWQPRSGGKPGRTEIAQAIQQAEDLISSVLKFSPAPVWINDEITWPYYTVGNGANGRMRVRASNFRLIELGTEATSFIASSNVTYIDQDGDGYEELASVFIDLPGTNTITDPNEIAVFYPGTGPDTTWEIRPVRVLIDTALNKATITLGKHLLVKPELQERLDAASVDGLDDNNFLDTVDVYRRYNNRSNIGTVTWPCGGCGVCTVCQTQASTICATVVDARNGMIDIQPAVWNDNTNAYDARPCTWVYPPASIRLNYRAGFTNNRLPRPLVDMSPELERAIGLLALTFLDRSLCECEPMRNLFAHWRADLAGRHSGPAEASSTILSRGMLESPLGTTRAGIYAWRVAQGVKIGEAVLNI